jgi:hypothetical protein
MLKELFTRVIQPTTNIVVSEDPEDDDIHEKIRKAVLKFLTDAGFPNLTVEVGPKNGCSHENCNINVGAFFPNERSDQATEISETFYECVRQASLIVFNEVLRPIVGPRIIINESYDTVIHPIDNKRNKIR